MQTERAADAAEDPVEYLVIRRPLFDTKTRAFAYEFLCHQHVDKQHPITDETTNELVIDAFLEIGLEKLVGDKLAFITLPSYHLLHDHAIDRLPPNVILNFTGEYQDDGDLVETLQTLSGNGYKTALNLVRFGREYLNAINIADIIKIDIQSLDGQQLTAHCKALKSLGKVLLAERVESLEDLESARSLGFDYFQGSFFTKPSDTGNKRLPSNKLALLQLLAKISDPEATIDELHTLISQDVTLSVKALRYVNSAGTGLPNRITSIKRAMMYLGRDTIRNWVAILAMSEASDKPTELVTTALIRGKMCEEMAMEAEMESPDMYYTVGMLSVLDAIIDAPMEQVIKHLPLDDELQDALLNRAGDMGAALQLTLDIEFGIRDETRLFRELPIGRVANCYLRALRWADDAKLTY